MNFVADESRAGPVIRALREAGHDVVAIVEDAKGATDEEVLTRALNEKRVLITEDRDFGELLYARGRSSPGVILVRFHSRARRAKPETVVAAVTKLGSRVRDAFTVVEPGRVRISGSALEGRTPEAADCGALPTSQVQRGAATVLLKPGQRFSVLIRLRSRAGWPWRAGRAAIAVARPSRLLHDLPAEEIGKYHWGASATGWTRLGQPARMEQERYSSVLDSTRTG